MEVVVILFCLLLLIILDFCMSDAPVSMNWNGGSVERAAQIYIDKTVLLMQVLCCIPSKALLFLFIFYCSVNLLLKLFSREDLFLFFEKMRDRQI